MKRTIPGYKDENGMFIKEPAKPIPEAPVPVKDPDVSLDDIARRIVLSLDWATRQLLEKVKSGEVGREVIGALKDCETMHRELAKKEKEFLENATDEQLERLLENETK